MTRNEIENIVDLLMKLKNHRIVDLFKKNNYKNIDDELVESLTSIIDDITNEYLPREENNE